MQSGLAEAKNITEAFIQQLLTIREQLVKDAHAYIGDPSGTNFEPIVCFPSMVVLYRYRVAHALHKLVPYYRASLLKLLTAARVWTFTLARKLASIFY